MRQGVEVAATELVFAVGEAHDRHAVVSQARPHGGEELDGVGDVLQAIEGDYKVERSSDYRSRREMGAENLNVFNRRGRHRRVDDDMAQRPINLAQPTADEQSSGADFQHGHRFLPAGEGVSKSVRLKAAVDIAPCRGAGRWGDIRVIRRRIRRSHALLHPFGRGLPDKSAIIPSQREGQLNCDSRRVLKPPPQRKR